MVTSDVGMLRVLVARVEVGVFIVRHSVADVVELTH